MQGGDISNESAPRVVFVWENLLAQLPSDRVKQEARFVKRKRYQSALNEWEDNDMMRHRLHDMSWRLGLNVDVLCTHPSDFADLLRLRLDETGYPYNRIHCFPLAGFNRELAYMPEVVAVYHGEHGSPFLFGSKGRLVTDASRMEV